MEEGLSQAVTVVLVTLALMSAAPWSDSPFGGRSSSEGASAQSEALSGQGAALRRGRVLGPEDAPVHITVFVDYQSPLSRTLHERLQKVRARYPDTVAVAPRPLPLGSHRRAFQAAVAAECAARQGRFAAYHRQLFERQGRLWETSFGQLARRADVSDLKGFRACLSASGEGPAASAVAERRRAARRVGFTGIPTFVVGQHVVKGLRPTAALDSLVRLALRAQATLPHSRTRPVR